MSSYFDFFCKNLENDCKLTEDRTIKGTCYTMCPVDEVKLREKEHLVHVLEVLGPMRMLVKSYSRSAADTNMAKPQQLRPYSVLEDTVVYLLLDVTRRVDVPTPVMYDFVNDRLRAVRQDMTIQRLPPEECVYLLEPMIRFYVFYGYRLSDLPLNYYDPVLNKKYLLECLKWYLYCCDSIQVGLGQVKEDSLAAVMSNLDLNKNKQLEERGLACHRTLMESLYILCNMDDVHPMFRYIGLSRELKRSPKLHLAYEIAVANMQGNYVRVCRLLDDLCVLTYCAAATYLPTLQTRALRTMSVAYHSPRLVVPAAVLARWLRLAHAHDAVQACAHYGLAAHGDAVRFDRTHFRADASLYQLKVEDIKSIFNVSIEDIFTYSK